MKNKMKLGLAGLILGLLLINQGSGQFRGGAFRDANAGGGTTDLTGYAAYADAHAHFTGDSMTVDGKLTVSGVITCAGFYVATDSSLIVKTDSFAALTGNRTDYRAADTAGMKIVAIDTFVPYANGRFVLKSDSIIYSLTHQIYGRTGDTSRFVGVVSVVNKLRMDTIGAINGSKMTFGADTFAAGAGNVLIFGDGNDTIATNLFKAKTGNNIKVKSGDSLDINLVNADSIMSTGKQIFIGANANRDTLMFKWAPTDSITKMYQSAGGAFTINGGGSNVTIRNRGTAIMYIRNPISFLADIDPNSSYGANCGTASVEWKAGYFRKTLTDTVDAEATANLKLGGQVGDSVTINADVSLFLDSILVFNKAYAAGDRPGAVADGGLIRVSGAKDTILIGASASWQVLWAEP